MSLAGFVGLNGVHCLPQSFKRLRKPAGGAAGAEAAAELSPARATSADLGAPSGSKPSAALVIDDDDVVGAAGASAAREVMQSEDEEDVVAEDEEEDELEAKDVKGKRPAKRAAPKAKGAAAGVGGKSVAAAASYLKYDVAKAAEGMWKV